MKWKSEAEKYKMKIGFIHQDEFANCDRRQK